MPIPQSYYNLYVLYYIARVGDASDELNRTYTFTVRARSLPVAQGLVERQLENDPEILSWEFSDGYTLSSKPGIIRWSYQELCSHG